MRLLLDYRRPSGESIDIEISVDADTTVGALAESLARRDPAINGASGPLTIARYDRNGVPTTVSSVVALGESGIRSGSTITLVQDSASADGAPHAGIAATLNVHSGPDAGRSFDLRSGANTVGRGPSCTVRLTDPLVSTSHARVLVGEEIEIIDDNSSNGILVGGEQVPRVVVRSGDRILLGDSIVSITPRGAASIGHAPLSPTVQFNRSPRVDPPFEGPEVPAPDPPTPPMPQRFPMMAAISPLFMAGALYLVTRSPFSLIFALLSPLMAVGSYFESRHIARQAFRKAVDHFRANLADLVVQLRQLTDEERRRRCMEHPGASEMAPVIENLAPLLWTRRPEHTSFMELRLGLGTQPSRIRIKSGNTRNSTPELHAELQSVIDQFAVVDRVPVVGSFDVAGSIGISGPEDAMLAVARGLLLQLVALHSPAELVLCGTASARSARRWDWVKWLPHTGPDHSPIQTDHFAATPPACTNLVGELTDLIAFRSESRSEGDPPKLPRIVVLVEDDTPIERSRLVQLAESGPAVGVHLIWVAPSTADIPAACRSFVEVHPTSGTVGTGRVVEGEYCTPVLVEPVDEVNAVRLARDLAPVVDAGALVDDAGDVPARVSFVAEAGRDLVEDPRSVIERWKESNSVHLPGAPRRRLKRDNTLRALVGRTATDPLHLDLRSQGPHALVGGTTGAGKSEFLQTWILGMAAAHSPQRVTFLFVDYKGGSAFADCVSLPHSVGLVTDLSPHLVQRALTSLNAELRYREHILNRKKAKDLLELERRNDPEAPPSLVIVVDEFAALVQEVPEFVDGVVNVAQRGRSLGLHLILATQRPAGVIRDNLRANTNLRVALRMADEEDSKDVVGTPLAASFAPELPGRGIAKTGPGRLSVFQSGYVGGWTSDTPPPPRIEVSTLVFGSGTEWDVLEEEPEDSPTEDLGPTDIERIVATLRDAAAVAGLDPPRKPWLPELARVYELAELPMSRRDDDLVFGVADRPEVQDQGTVSFKPDLEGNLAVFGTGGSGKSVLLRTLAVSAGLTARGGPCFVYGLDFGTRGLSMLDALPHVGSIVTADDVERTARLLRQLREAIDERAVRYAKVNAGTIDEYRKLASAPDEPRVLLLLDGFAAFRNAYEVSPLSWIYEQLQSIAADGRPVGVHVVISADRSGVLPGALASAVQRRLALRVADEMDESALGVPKGAFGEDAPPGRGFLDGVEVQVAVLGGSPDVAEQAAAIERLAESMRRAGAKEAPPVRRLPERVEFDELPVDVGGLPAFAIADETLSPVGFDPSTPFLVAGPSASGRTTLVRVLLKALARRAPQLRYVYFGHPRSPLAQERWDRSAIGVQEAAALASELTEEWQEEPGRAAETVVVIDSLGDFLNSDADYPLQDLLKACRANGVFVIGEGETSDVAGTWPLLSAIKSARHGVVLQPDQIDGDSLFRTPFPRMSRSDFPPGRGMYVRNGKAIRVQVAFS